MGALTIVLGACTSSEPDAVTAPPPSVTTSVTTSTTTSTTTPLPSTTTTPPPPETRWITVAGDGFLDSRTGESFVPVGVNLLLKQGGGGGDRLFQVYDPEWVDEQLAAIAALDFNTVRFFLDMCMGCTATSDGIRDDYLDNVSDLLTRIEAHGLVAFPTSNDVPDPGYSDRLPCCDQFGGYRNSLYLAPEGHDIAIEYWTDLITGIQDRGAPTHHLLGWQLANEQFYLRPYPPISLTEGTITTADGETYDLSDDAAMTEMAASNLREFITVVGDTIRELDTGALISMGFPSTDEIGSGRFGRDERWMIPDEILPGSTLDFVDLHFYPGFGDDWDTIGALPGMFEAERDYPVLLGEFGAFEAAYTSPEEGAAAMARWQAGSCELGFDGWLLWFWGADKDDEVYTVEVADAAIGRAISPLTRPDPCDPTPYQSANYALGRSVTVSAEENDEYRRRNLVDGSAGTWWSAAEGPPQWAEVDLEEDREVARVEILIGHVSPTGPQTHRIYLRGAGEAAPGALVGEVSADARHGDVLVAEFEPVSGVRHVRLETVAMDGWVIIHELSVFGPGG